jgi:DNA-binding FrmR family transcriptional regulator
MEGISEIPVKHDTQAKLLNRLSRIEGKVRGITRMVEEWLHRRADAMQAVRGCTALARVETEMLKSHLHHCIEGAIVSGDAKEQRKKAGELIELLGRASR